MNNTLWKIHFLLITLCFLSISSEAQQWMMGSNGKVHSLSIKFNPTHNIRNDNQNIRLLIVDYEKIRKSKRHHNFFRVLRIGSGIAMADKFNFPIFTVNYDCLYDKNRHFFEFGLGTKIISASTHINLGYRLLLKNNFHFLFLIQPATFTVYEFFEEGDSEGHNNFVDFSFSLGYKIPQHPFPKVSNSIRIFSNHLSIQSSLYAFSFIKVKEPRPSLLLKLAYLHEIREKQQIEISGGAGLLAEGGNLWQIGISYLIGEGKHLFEVGTNLIYADQVASNYNNYTIPQIQLGYRYQCQKIPMFARIAYAPYIRTLDWKREGGLHHNMVLGVGYRFGK